MKSVLTKDLFWDEKYLRKVYDLFIEKISLKDWRIILIICHTQTSSVLANVFVNGPRQYLWVQDFKISAICSYYCRVSKAENFSYYVCSYMRLHDDWSSCRNQWHWSYLQKWTIWTSVTGLPLKFVLSSIPSKYSINQIERYFLLI